MGILTEVRDFPDKIHEFPDETHESPDEFPEFSNDFYKGKVPGYTEAMPPVLVRTSPSEGTRCWILTITLLTARV